MIEQQINEIILTFNIKPVLITHIGKILAESHDEILDILDYFTFKDFFVNQIIVILKLHKIKNIVIPKRLQRSSSQQLVINTTMEIS